MLWGDPRLVPHPVRFIGFLCIRFESLTRAKFTLFSSRLQGIFTFLLVISVSVLSLWVFLRLCGAISVHARVAGACIICYFCTAAGDLVKHSTSVRKHLERGDIIKARQAVAMMVGRDTDELDAGDISRACIESVSENLVDGITAPVFWALICALTAPVSGVDPIVCAAFGFFAYKAVNTMDSMFGYKNKRYIDFGRCAAKVDDFCNFLPARMSGLCVIAAALFPGYNALRARQAFLEDRLKSSSPNAAHTEAAVAGALGIRLGGQSSYFGEPVVKPYLGDELHAAGPVDIKRVNRLVLISAVLFYLAGFVIHWILVTVFI